MPLTSAGVLSPLLGLARLIVSLFRRPQTGPVTRLEARLITRAIVAEIPEDISLHLYDENGTKHKGVYAIGLLLWNRGNKAITPDDFTQAAPLRIKTGIDAKIVATRLIALEQATDCRCEHADDHTLAVDFDCINPGEYLVLTVFVTGNHNASLEIRGRIVGQETPIDHIAEEARATWSDRGVALFLLALLLNAIPGFFVAGGLIVHWYGFSAFWHSPSNVPFWLFAPFMAGAMIIIMFLISRFFYWVERRKYPESYPMMADLEPPLLENMRGLVKTVFLGEKQRLSTSLFNWGEPVIVTSKKLRRFTTDDWFE